MTIAPPQMLLTESLKPRVVEPQVSVAIATPVLFVLVFAGHSRTRSVGQLKLGAVVSCTVIVWTQPLEFPQPSIALHVRKIVIEPPQPFVTASLKLIVTSLHSSCAVAMPVLFVL